MRPAGRPSTALRRRMRPICCVAASAPRSRINGCARCGARPRLAAGPPRRRIARRGLPAGLI